MIPYKLGDTSFNMPESWHEVTVKQWLDFRKIDVSDICAVLAVLSGLSREQFFNTREIDLVDKLIPFLNWMQEPIDLKSQPVPKSVIISGQEVEVTGDITFKTYGQKLTYHQELFKYMDENGTAKVEFIPVALSIYLCPDPFSDIKAAALIPEIEKLPITIAYPIASFFLTNSLLSFQTNPKS